MQEFLEFCDNAFQDILDKINLKDSSGVNFIAQVSIDRDNNTPVYWFQITNLGYLLQPLTWSNEDPEWIKKDVTKFIKELNFDSIEIAYYETLSDRAQKMSEQYKKLAEDSKHRLALEGPTKLSNVRKGYKKDVKLSDLKNVKPVGVKNAKN